jgi:hypothetical protein
MLATIAIVDKQIRLLLIGDVGNPDRPST